MDRLLKLTNFLLQMPPSPKKISTISGSFEIKTAGISVIVYIQKLVGEIRNVHGGMRLVFRDPAPSPFARQLTVAFQHLSFAMACNSENILNVAVVRYNAV